MPRLPLVDDPEMASPARPGAMVRVRSPEEREYERRRRQIAIRERRIGQLRAELAGLRGALAAFEGLCQARVGDLLAELRRLGAAAADVERRLQRPASAADAGGAPDPSTFTGGGGAPEAATAGAAGPTAGGGARGPDQGDAAGSGEGFGSGAPRTALRRLPAAQAAEAKRLYLDLAKRCHPDRAAGDADRRRREALMLRINEAWRRGDLTALHALRRETAGSDPAAAAVPVAERLAWATAELSRLDDLVVDLRAELIFLREGRTHRLWRRHEAGEPVIDRLERDLERRVAKEGRRVDALTAAYRRVHDERRPPRSRPPGGAAASAPAAD